MSEPINELDCMRFKKKDNLLKHAEMAVAWGIPDNESTGMSSGEFVNIISRLVSRVKSLEKENEQLRSKAS